MQNLYARIAVVIAVTALSVVVIPGVDDAVELVFQVVVLVASSSSDSIRLKFRLGKQGWLLGLGFA